MYPILGSQASTRWPIVRQGAKSLQTQVVFRKIVCDTIVEDDQTITINNMRAILDTHVILNTVITPGMILVPGSLIILKQKIPGYNNILTMANYSMSFGLNGDVNKTPEPKKEAPTEINVNRSHTKSVSNVINHSNDNIIKTINGQNLTRNIPRVNTQSYARTVSRPNSTRYLVEVYGASAVIGFVALKILMTVI